MPAAEETDDPNSDQTHAIPTTASNSLESDGSDAANAEPSASAEISKELSNEQMPSEAASQTPPTTPEADGTSEGSDPQPASEQKTTPNPTHANPPSQASDASHTSAGDVPAKENDQAQPAAAKAQAPVTKTAETSQTFVLRILSGPHNGAEVTLQERPLLLGKGDMCDIVLLDESLQDQHAKFFVQEGNLYCAIENGAIVQVDGQPVSSQQTIQPFQAIVCGTTLMAMGPKDVLWPSIQIQQPRSTQAVASQLAANACVDSNHALDASSHRPFRKWFGWGMVVLAIGIGATAFWIHRKSQEQLQNAELSSFPIVALKESIETVLQAHHVEPEFFKITLSGRLFSVQGYVAKVQEREALEKHLKQLPKIHFQSLHIYTQEKIVQQVQDFLRPYPALMAAPNSRLDGVLLKGYLHPIDRLPSIKKRLLSDVPGLNFVETSLLSPDEVYELASNVLLQSNLMGLLKIQTVPSGIVITGHIQTTDEPRWHQAQKLLKSTFRNICKVLTQVVTVAPDTVKKNFFPAPISTVSIPKGETPWIDLKNGNRYFEGSFLPSGYKVQSINKNGICLQKNDDVVLFDLTEL